MPSDTFYGADAQMRIGLMADKDTDPTAWWPLQFIRGTFNPQKDRIDRPRLGAARHNALDPVKPIPGFQRGSFDLVFDADTAQTPRVLRALLGAPATTGASAPYTHVWNSGVKAPQLACIQILTGDTGDKVRIYRGLTLGAISQQVSGDQVQNFDLQISGRYLSQARATDWLSGTLNSFPGEAPCYRAVFRVDGTAASNTLEGSWSWDRQLTDDAFLSAVAELTGLRPGGGTLTGSARFRAVGEAFDDIADADTQFAPDLQLLGTVSGHSITLAHLHALLNKPALEIPGPAILERNISWFGYQTDTEPGARITILNAVASYA